jgi:N-acetylglucosaminyl-diphospho-decaprenol L-rhamnosyltransferase
MAPETAVLILNYNGERFIRATLDSLLAQRRPVNIVIIDNNSKDSSCDIIKKEYPTVELIENDKNYPFGTAYNRVMPTRKEKYQLILNNDITVEPDAVGKAEDLLKKNLDIAAVVFLEFQMDKPVKFPYDRDYIVKKRFGMDFGSHVHFKSRKDPPQRSIFFWGGASLVRTKVVKKVRFDQDFDWYFEDVDLGWSIFNLLGMQCMISPDCIVHHMGGVSTKKRFKDKERDRKNHRNSMLSFAKNATTGQLIRGYPEIFYHMVFRQKDRWELIKQMKRKRRLERNLPKKE